MDQGMIIGIVAGMVGAMVMMLLLPKVRCPECRTLVLKKRSTQVEGGYRCPKCKTQMTASGVRID